MSRTHEVSLVDFPVARFRQMQQQHDAVLRELSLIALDSGNHAGVPRRLIALVHEMHERFGTMTRVFRDGVAEAAARDDVVTTLRLTVPAETLQWCEEFLMLFEESDEFCRQGTLLTPPSPPEVVEFRQWWVGEIMRQMRDGAAPTPYWA